MTSTNYQFSVAPHGKWQLEIEVVRPLSEEPAIHDLDAYIFTPDQLDVDKNHYPVEAFFRDLVAYTRYKTPRIPLKQLVNPACSISPLMRIEQALNVDDFLKLDEQPLVYEFRTTVNVFRGQVDELFTDLREALESASVPIVTIEELADEGLTEISEVMSVLERIERSLLAPGISDHLRQACSWVAESLSRRSERFALKLYDLFTGYNQKLAVREDQTLNKREFSSAILERCRQEFVKQGDFRAARSMPGHVHPGNAHDLEHFIYRGHEIKKWAGSAMYMTLTESHLNNRLMHVLFGAAAAVAMTFTVVAGVLAGLYFGATNVFAVSIVAIAAYIFKDRIKDILRAVSLRLIPRMVSDRIQLLTDPRSGQQCGKTKESVAYPALERLSNDVRRLRMNRKDLLPEQGLSEEIIHYHRSVYLDGGRLLRAHERLSGLTEILRFDMRRWGYRMDAATEELRYFEGDELKTLEAGRVYHITLILSFHRRGDSEPPTLHRFRIVANVSGILRVEPVSSIFI